MNVQTYGTHSLFLFAVSFLLLLPSTDDEAGHQEDEEDDAPGDGHGQDGGLVGVPDSENICMRD